MRPRMAVYCDAGSNSQVEREGGLPVVELRDEQEVTEEREFWDCISVLSVCSC